MAVAAVTTAERSGVTVVQMFQAAPGRCSRGGMVALSPPLISLASASRAWRCSRSDNKTWHSGQGLLQLDGSGRRFISQAFQAGEVLQQEGRICAATVLESAALTCRPSSVRLWESPERLRKTETLRRPHRDNSGCLACR